MNLTAYAPLWWLVFLLPLGLGYYFSLVERPGLKKSASFLLRALGIVMLVLSLCRPAVLLETRDRHVCFLVDASESIALSQARDALGEVKKRIASLKGSDTHSVYIFGDKLRQGTADELIRQVAQWEKQAGGGAFRRHTAMPASLLAARLHFPAGKAKQLVLFSDGKPTRGNMDEALSLLKEENVDIFRKNLPGIGHAETAVVDLSPATPHAYFGERVRMTATLNANCIADGTLTFLNRGVVEASVPVSLAPGEKKEISCEMNMNTAGRSVWTAELRCDKDYFPFNNRASCSIDVEGKARVLAIHRKPRKLRPLTRALRKQNIRLDVRGEKGLPLNLNGMLEFDAILLADVPATSLSTRQMLNLKRYVLDFGGGFIMLGSENSFGLGGYYRTPVEEILPLVSRYEKEKEYPSLAMALVLDKSGSMNGMKIELARAAAKAAVELLSDRDQIAVVAFDGQPYVVSPMGSAAAKSTVTSAIDTIQANGGTNMYPAMAAARDMLSTASARLKHMIVLGDGHSSSGDFLGISGEMADESITVSTVALGSGADQALMNRIAEIGKGRYYQTMDPESVPRIFTKETMAASRSSIREEPFLPVPVMRNSFLEGVDFTRTPYLLGYVMTKIKASSQPVLATESGDPLMAVGRYGLGKSIAFTSDAGDRWAGEWLVWRTYGKFWAQTLRAVIRKQAGMGIHVTACQDAEDMCWLVRRTDMQGIPATGVSWDVRLRREGESVQRLTAEEIGYGLYRIRAPFTENKDFTLSMTDTKEDALKVLNYHKTYPAEYRLESKPHQAFTRLASLTQPNGLPQPEPVHSSMIVSNPVIGLGMLMLLLGILLRRI